MASLTSCMGKAGKALRTEDREAILARFSALTEAGASPESAARMAVDEQIAAVRSLIAAEQRRLADKAKADAEVGDFTLTGSDRAVDVGAAAGQHGIFDEPAVVNESLTTSPANDRDTFTIERLDRDTGSMKPVTFKRGEYVQFSVGEGGKLDAGDIDGISQARRQFSVGGLWYDFGFANKAERPAEPKKDTVQCRASSTR